MQRATDERSRRDAMSTADADEKSRMLAEEVARRSYGKLVAFLAARTRDLAAAEDALSDAFASALTDWPKNGCPCNPEAWLMTVARRKGIDATRRRMTADYAAEEIRQVADVLAVAPNDAEIPDRRLGLMFACAHPAIEAGIRAPLILQVVLGLTAEAIASAFLTSPATMGQRLVRAKKKISEAGVPFQIPEREELRERLETVLEAIYAAFAEGWIDASGADSGRRDLAERRSCASVVSCAPLLWRTAAFAGKLMAHQTASRSQSGPTPSLCHGAPCQQPSAKTKPAPTCTSCWRR